MGKDDGIHGGNWTQVKGWVKYKRKNTFKISVKGYTNTNIKLGEGVE